MDCQARREQPAAEFAHACACPIIVFLEIPIHGRRDQPVPVSFLAVNSLLGLIYR